MDTPVYIRKNWVRVWQIARLVITTRAIACNKFCTRSYELRVDYALVHLNYAYICASFLQDILISN